MIYWIETCNRGTECYSLVGKKACCVLLSVRHTRSHYGAVCLSHTPLSVEVRARLTASKKRWILLPFIWKYGSVLEQYQAVVFDVQSLRLDLFKSLCFGFRGSGGNELYSPKLCIFLCVYSL